MTAYEYEEAYINARNHWPKLIRSAMVEIKAAYIDAGEKVEAAFFNSSGLASERLSAIETQLRATTGIISDKIMDEIPASIIEGQSLYSAADEKLLTELFTGSDKVTKAGLRNMIVSANSRLISDTVNRMYQDGYTLSTRVWNIAEDYQVQITRLINSGTAQGLSIPDIAKSIGDYTAGGSDALTTAARWGNVIVKNVDWKALRLVRTEFSASMKVGAVTQGEMNPASTKLYDWVRINTQQHSCACPDLAAGSPYTAENIPAQPHSNCFCQIRPRLRDLKDFAADVKRWNDGEHVPDLDKWYTEYYLPSLNSI